MILSPVAPHKIRSTLAIFGRALDDPLAGRVLRRIAASYPAGRARGAIAARHHDAAVKLAKSFGMGTRAEAPRAGFGWDGRSLRTETEAYVLLHEIAHYQLAGPNRRRRVEFGLGPGPETGAREKSLRHLMLHGLAREREEAMASLLGILWEVELGQPALASFLDQNWLEGAGRPGAGRYFASILERLQFAGFITGSGRPTRRIGK